LFGPLALAKSDTGAAAVLVNELDAGCLQGAAEKRAFSF
jgi:hypothetical protein